MYIIDDFTSELDTECRRLLVEPLKATHAQIFVNAVSTDQICDITDEKGKIFKVGQGKINFKAEV